MSSIRYPAHWTSQKLKHVASLKSGEGITSNDISDLGEYPVYGGNGVRGYTSSYTHEGTYPLIGRQGALCGNINYASGKFWASEHAVVVHVRDGHVVRWLGELLRSMNLNQYSQSAAQPGISVEVIENLPIPIPPQPEQEVIANYLDRETARIDGLIAAKERMLALLEEKRAALISRVVTRGLDSNVPLKPSGQEWLGEIPAHWGVQRLKQLAEVRGGLTLGKQYSGDLFEYPYLRVANVQDGYLDLEDVLTVEVPASEAASNLLAKGDVLMNEGGDIDKLGRGCVWRDEIAPCLHQNHVFAVRPHSVDSDWLALWTSTLEAKRYFESRAKRSTNLASISGSNIKELPVPLPPIEEQLAIRQFLDDRRHRLEKVGSELRHSLCLLTERRAALITAAVTGQLPLEEMRA
ncbi:MAG: restriction endonuclease subunit S [Thauera sp.]